MTKKIGELLGEQMLSGIYPDLPHRQPPIFRNAKNVLFSDNSVQPIPGQYIITAGQEGLPIRGLLSIRDGATPVLFYGDDSKLYRYTIAGGTAGVGSGFANAGNAWSLQRWGSWVLATNNVNAPQIYKGTSFDPLTGLGSVMTRARIFLVYKNYVLAFNTDVNDSRIAWCTADNPEQWVAASNNTARLLDIRDTTSGISAACIANERVFYWTLKSMSVMGFIGPPGIFSSNKVTDDIGAFGPQAVTEVAGNLFGIGPNGAWMSDGSGYNYIDEGAVHDKIFSSINLAHAHKCVAWHDVFTKQVIFWYPAGSHTENSRAEAYNYKDKNWAPRGDSRSAALEAGDFQWGLLGDTSGNIYAQSLIDAPVSAQDPDIHVTGEGTFSLLFGQSGFGQGGFGGSLGFDE